MSSTPNTKERPSLATPRSSRGPKHLDWKLRLGLTVLTALLRTYVGLVKLTSRVDTSELESVWSSLAAGKNVIGAILHQDVLISAFFFKGRRIVSMVSTSKDGERISYVARKLGHDVVRGSGAQRGRQALAEMIDHLERTDGCLAALTIDGSRGPANVCKKGVIRLAQQTGVPIVPIRTWSRRKVLLPSWDRTLLPLPFSRIVVLAGEPIFVDLDVTADELEEARLRVEDELRRLTEDAQRRAEGRGGAA